jgi:hypothetical protein
MATSWSNRLQQGIYVRDIRPEHLHLLFDLEMLFAFVLDWHNRKEIWKACWSSGIGSEALASLLYFNPRFHDRSLISLVDSMSVTGICLDPDRHRHQHLNTLHAHGTLDHASWHLIDFSRGYSSLLKLCLAFIRRHEDLRR